MRKDETFSAIAGRTDEREACEQEVFRRKGGHTLRRGPVRTALAAHSDVQSGLAPNGHACVVAAIWM